MTNFTKEDFRQRYGYDLEAIIPNDHDPSSKVDRAIADVVDLIKEHILKYTRRFDFDDLSETQNEHINKACMEQLAWEIKTGGFQRDSGYNPISASLLPFPEIEKRVIAPNAKRILNNHIISRGF
ncbi:MAG: hypothetical protein PHW40_00915 [Candidatus Izemoplasmatales bacterium]|nr:hypothetical protein [Candidatus Izemoplasmatales bacterium]